MTKNKAAQELGRRGGQKFLEKYGHEGMSELGKKSAQAQSEKRGSDYFKAIRKMGKKTAVTGRKKSTASVS